MAPVYLMIRVDEFGEPIELSTSTISGTPSTTDYGVLNANQSYILKLENLSGVVAKTTIGNVDSLVRCTILLPRN